MLTKEAAMLFKRYLSKNKITVSEDILQDLHEKFKNTQDHMRYDIYNNSFYEFLDINYNIGGVE